MTLTEFLLARIAEDEAMWQMAERADLAFTVRGPMPDAFVPAGFARRMLAECEAKRRIVEQCSESEIYGPGAAFLCRHIPTLLAAVYAEHPDYRAEWRS